MRSRISEMSVSAVGNYADSLDKKGYVESKRGHRLKSQVRRLENVLVVGNWLYRSVRLIERNWRNEVLEGRTAYDPDEEKSIREMLSQWALPSRRCLEEIESLRAMRIKVRGAKTFESYCTSASEALAGRDVFFDDLEKAWRWSVLTAKHRASPRPVRIDDAGRVFEMTGERFVPAGMTPEDVREAFSDVDKDRTRTLEEIIASRTKNGAPDQAEREG